MGQVEVLVASVEKEGEKLYKEMNITTDAIIANQGGRYNYTEKFIDNKKVKIIETADRGVGKNRNIALLNAEAEYLVFSDEDIIYCDDYEKKIIESFGKHPDADILVFDLKYLNQLTKQKTKKIQKEKRIFVFNAMRYGAPRCVIKRKSLLKSNLWFSLLYGGGALYACGEDSLFLREAFKKGLKVYVIPYVIANVKQEKSSWFHGYDDKFFRDKGVWAANAFPLFCYLYTLILSGKFVRKTEDYSFWAIWRLMLEGIENYKKNDIV